MSHHFKLNKLSLSAVVAMALQISSAQAAPIFDDALVRLMSSGSQQNQRVRVVAFFHSKRPMMAQGRPSNLNPAQVERALMADSDESQRELIDRLRKNPSQSQMRITRFWIVNAIAFELPVSQLSQLANENSLSFVSSNYRVNLVQPGMGRSLTRADLNREEAYTYGLEKIGIPALRQAHPDLIGKGVRVGVIDTGMDASHPDLKGKVAAFVDYTDKPKKDPYDDNGHGTHVGGTIGGGNASGTTIGIAPGVQFVVAKFLSGSGSGTFEGAIKAMQYMADPDGNPNTADAPSLVSNSWGGGKADASKDPASEPLCQAVSNWAKLGILPVFAAGNSGPSAQTLGLPAACPGTIAIGATDADDKIASFSSRGPGIWKTVKVTKPDVSAPGVKVLSSFPNGAYKEASGTSMATPHVAGMAALLYQLKPKMTVDQMIDLIRKTTKAIGQDPNIFGTGRIDAVKATAAAAGAFNTQRRM